MNNLEELKQAIQKQDLDDFIDKNYVESEVASKLHLLRRYQKWLLRQLDGLIANAKTGEDIWNLVSIHEEKAETMWVAVQRKRKE